MACVSRNVRRTFHVPSGVPVQRSISERDCSHPVKLSSEKQRIKPFEVSPHDCKQSLAANLRTVIASKRFSSHPVVELGLTGLTSTSRSIRTTCAKSLALLRSSESVLSVRPRILLLHLIREHVQLCSDRLELFVVVHKEFVLHVACDHFTREV